MTPLSSDIAAWREHFQDEADAAFLYRTLANMEQDPKRRDIFDRLAQVEDRHAEIWRQVLSENEQTTELPRPSMRARLLAWVGTRWGTSLLLPILLREEGHEVRAYLELHRESAPGSAKDASRTLAAESARHAETLGSPMRNRGTNSNRAVTSVMSYTDSTTALPRTSAWSRESSAPLPKRRLSW